MASKTVDDEKNDLRTKINVLELELKQRNAECVRLRDEALQAVALKKKVDSQHEVIVGLRSELEYARAAHASALEALEKEKKQSRDREHYERMQRVAMCLSADDSAPKVPAPLKIGAEVGGIVPTSSGPQVVCKSSNISSIGFAPVERPVDFLGGVHRFSKQPGQEDYQIYSKESTRGMRVLPGFETGTPMPDKHTDDDYDELQERLKALRRR